MFCYGSPDALVCRPDGEKAISNARLCQVGVGERMKLVRRLQQQKRSGTSFMHLMGRITTKLNAHALARQHDKGKLLPYMNQAAHATLYQSKPCTGRCLEAVLTKTIEPMASSLPLNISGPACH